jgi:hypothetical protein
MDSNTLLLAARLASKKANKRRLVYEAVEGTILRLLNIRRTEEAEDLISNFLDRREFKEMVDDLVEYGDPVGARLAAKWENLPKGWTDESRKEFWDTLTGDVKHPVTKCIEKMEGKFDDPGAFCASLADRVEPGWRSKKEASSYRVAVRHLQASKEKMEEGDRVQISIARGRTTEATVTSVRHNWRARKFPYEVKFTDDQGNDYTGKRRSILYADQTGTKYLGQAGAGSKKKIEESLQRGQARADAKADRAEAGIEALRKLNLQPGDVIKFKYTDGVQTEIVTGVNFRTGKVGIDRFRGNARAKREYIDDIRGHRETTELLNYLTGLRRRKKSDRSTRWLFAQNIVEVISRAKGLG